jgi:hypothetical protein
MATKARLHWFWRGAIATLVAAGCDLAYGWLVDVWPGNPAGALWVFVLRYNSDSDLVRYALLGAHFVCFNMPMCIGAIVAYGLLTRWFGCHADSELHCRKCDYILRGLSEPRCPECGERI